tara:strand:- start:207 stop:413 length:207 start_codon:yes stop_codon:yes gene_type:complete
MTDAEKLGWSMFWSGKEKDKQIHELITILQDLGAEEELSAWRAKVIQRAEDKEHRRIKRELKKLKLKN